MAGQRILGSPDQNMSANSGAMRALFQGLRCRVAFRVCGVMIRPALTSALTRPACRALAAACVATLVTPAHAELPADAVPRALALAAQAAQALAPPGARIQVEPGAIDARLKLAPCWRVDAYLPAGNAAWGRTRIGLRCTEGAAAWNVSLPVTVQVWARAAVLASALPAGARLDASQLVLTEVDWAAGSSPAHAEVAALQGRVLSRPLPAGAAPRVADLQVRQWFALGATVRVTANGSGFSISAEGQALTPGLEGQTARVRTENGRVLTGRPVGDHRMEVNL